MRNRIESLIEIFSSKKLDGCFIADEKNMFYFTGFSQGSRLLIPVEGESLLFVSGVNYEAAKEKVENARVELVKMGEDIDKRVAEEISRLKLRCIGFDSLEASTYLRLRRLLKGKTRLRGAGEIVWSLRRVKDEAELTLIRKAAELTSCGMKRAFEITEAGISEREVASEIEYEMRRLGSDGVAFDTIVASGPNSAFPHSECGERKIIKGDLVMIDMGAKYHGYCADLTRTLIMGKPSSDQAVIYNAVRKAQEIAISKMRDGVKAWKVDAVARDFLKKMGYGEYFVHRLGHGVGLDIHEPPTLSPTSKDILKSGNIVTVEPGIYIPNFGGVRIEDTLLVSEEKAEKLTEAPYFILES